MSVVGRWFWLRSLGAKRNYYIVWHIFCIDLIKYFFCSLPGSCVDFSCSPHINAIPIDPNTSSKVQARMMTLATFDLREVQNPDISIRSVLGDEEEWDGGYLYAEINGKRLLHKIRQGDGSSGKVPVQFGREVLASVVGNADLAHWKACEVDKEKEEELATKFRGDLEAFRK